MDAHLGIMAFLITSIVSRQFATALKPRNSVLNQPTFRRSISTSAALSKIEERIGRGEGGRGIEEIVIRGEFARACEHLARLPQNSVRGDRRGVRAMGVTAALLCAANLPKAKTSPPSSSTRPAAPSTSFVEDLASKLLAKITSSKASADALFSLVKASFAAAARSGA